MSYEIGPIVSTQTTAHSKMWEITTQSRWKLVGWLIAIAYMHKKSASFSAIQTKTENCRMTYYVFVVTHCLLIVVWNNYSRVAQMETTNIWAKREPSQEFLLVCTRSGLLRFFSLRIDLWKKFTGWDGRGQPSNAISLCAIHVFVAAAWISFKLQCPIAYTQNRPKKTSDSSYSISHFTVVILWFGSHFCPRYCGCEWVSTTILQLCFIVPMTFTSVICNIHSPLFLSLFLR